MASWNTLVMCVGWAASVAAQNLPPSCDSEVYCRGSLLSTVQLAVPKLFADSKTFVDMKQINSQNVTLANFNALMTSSGGNPSRDQVKQFVDTNFEEGNELEVAVPQDWVSSPPVLLQIQDEELRNWAKDLNGLWRNLTRQVNTDVQVNSDKYSLLYVPNPFVIPGGRFKELYYWDTYWIVRGLLVCDMNTTVKGIIENFLYMLDNYGIIPNGGRVYYLQRSQPPLLTSMLYSYYEQTNDYEFVKKNIHLLENEFSFWMNNRTVSVTKNSKTYTMARYYSPSEGPRPESYREDYENAQGFDTEERKQEFYTDIKSAAESGWDFSARWFKESLTNGGNLTHIDTQNIIPVDLNAIIYKNAHLLAELFYLLKDTEKGNHYQNVAEKWKIAVNEVLWNDDEGSWFDYDIRTNKQRTHFYPSNFAPLWTDCYDKENIISIAEKVVKYIETNKIEDFLGGIPASLDDTGEQWDYPNAWPPLQIIMIQGLAMTKVQRAQDVAYKLAQTWVHSNFIGYKETTEMFEKYDANNPGKFGGGGEYVVQSGFGWTNGIIFELLKKYGKTLTATQSYDTNMIEKRSVNLLELLSPYSSRGQ